MRGRKDRALHVDGAVQTAQSIQHQHPEWNEINTPRGRPQISA